MNLPLDLREAFFLAQKIDYLSVRDEPAPCMIAQKLDHKFRVEVVTVRMGDQQEIHGGEGSSASNHLGKQFLRRGKIEIIVEQGVNQHLLAARLDHESFVADVGYVHRLPLSFDSDSGGRIGRLVLLRREAGGQQRDQGDDNCMCFTYFGVPPSLRAVTKSAFIQ